jgi:hypothetical protein
MWYSLANRHFRLAYFVFTCAVLTKVAPLILAPLFLLFFSWSGIALSLFTALALLCLVSLGQNQNVLESLAQILSIRPVGPQPTSEQFLGLNNALSRLFGITDSSSFQSIETLSFVTLLVLYVWAILVLLSAFRMRTALEHREVVAYFFALFMTLLPLMHLGQTHRHTFIFLTPVFIAMKYLTLQIKDLSQQRKYSSTFNLIFLSYSFFSIYALDFYDFNDLRGLPFLSEFKSSLVMLTEPSWVNIFLFLIVLIFLNFSTM